MTVRSSPTFTGLSLDELTDLLHSRTRALAARRFLAAQRPVPATLPERVPDIAARAWDTLRAAAPLPPWRSVTREESADGTVKRALDLAGATVETVLIPNRSRSTVCISSQAGCTRSCRFCATARIGFRRHLTAGEMVLQYYVAAAEAPALAPARNVVFMGMGEPLDNLDEVLQAVACLTDEGAPRLADLHVTVSTSGVLPAMRRFLETGRGGLALSLNATTDAVRESLMPHNRTWPIAALMEALREDQARHPGRRCFVEYVMLDGINDTDEDAHRLVELLTGIAAVVNLIPHNTLPASDLRPSPDARLLHFQQIVHAGGVRCQVRWPRGRDIAAACGQLAGRGAGTR